MNRTAAIFFAITLAASSASAQSLQAIKLQPAATTQMAPAAELDQEALARRKLEIDNKKLTAENARLKQENADLSARVDALTSLGGSEVHAYCASDSNTISRNTAGVESDCRSLGGYTCEPVSGLCRTSCQTTDMCSPGFTCDTEIEKCINTSGY